MRKRVRVKSDGFGHDVDDDDDDDDESLDSDEAMGASDDEQGRFEGFRFGERGSALGPEVARGGMLDEDESDGFAADAVDLADVLDWDSGGSSSSGGEGEDDDDEEELVVSDGDEDANDPRKLSALQDLLGSLDAGGSKKQRSQLDLAQEAATPSEYGLNPKQKLSVADLLATITDPALRRSLKILADDGGKKSSSSGGIPGKLSIPLPKRQQDRIDRTAAFEKSKETLSRWIETVKHNRRAEHLVFPLIDQDVEAAKSTKRLLPNSKPINDLEQTIQNILVDSGLAETGKKQDDEIQRFEEMATNQLPIEEVRARQAELRKARDLLFREEIRAKRIKKIKSKSYRRVHRKERERNLLRDRDALAEAGILPPEDETEKMDRRRAEERMGQRHRESRWAKGLKDSGRAVWDDDARDGVAEMLRHDEELKRRMHGRGEEEGSESESESEKSGEDEEDFTQRMREKLSKLSTNTHTSETKLSSMKFMQKAEAARRAQNEEAVERLQRELDGGSEQEESDDEVSGRRKFGPRRKITTAIKTKEIRQDFEEGHDSDQENLKPNDDVEIVVNGSESKINGHARKGAIINQQRGRDRKGNSITNLAETEEMNPFLNVKKKSKKTTIEPIVEISSVPKLSQQKSKPKAVAKTITIIDPNDSDNSFRGFSPPSSSTTTTLLDREALIKQAFAADEDLMEKTFAAEKAALASTEEPETIISGGVPGWGSWIGPGLSKRDKREAKLSQAATTKIIKSSAGTLASQRKDKNLEKVIISEKRVPKTVKYLANSLPHPFESKTQYERSLRLPIGPEFTTKTTFQDMTKPRVIIKGGVIAPLRRPLM